MPDKTTLEQLSLTLAAKTKQTIATMPPTDGILPVFDFRDACSFPPAVLQSRLFAAIKIALFPNRTIVPIHMAFAAGWGSARIEYTGPQLTQDHECVLGGLIAMHQGACTSAALSFTKTEARRFAVNVLKRADDPASGDYVIECVRDLAAGHLFIRDYVNMKQKEVSVHFLRDYARDGNRFNFRIDPRILMMFKGNQTFVVLAERNRYPNGLATWMLGFVRSTPCDRLFPLEMLRQLSGYARVKRDGSHDSDPRRFNEDLIRALDRLLEGGSIRGYMMADQSVRVRKGPIATDKPRVPRNK